ncbi:putative adhesin [Endozoicomonas euniceicola]|uniref:putative adhesin n=1 Tax=Endozoicomonas euniceicola TaxID=1234143 RepID=UPI00385105EB
MIRLYTCDRPGLNIQNLAIEAYGHYIPEQYVQGRAADDSCLRSTNAFDVPASMLFDVPAETTLFFYCPHGSTLDCWLSMVITCQYPYFEVCLPGQKVVNYFLEAAFVNKKGPRNNDERIKKTLKWSATCIEPVPHHPFLNFDIVTIEPGYKIELSSLLRTLHLSGHVYQRVHCVFCRCRKGEKDFVYEPGFKRHPGFRGVPGLSKKSPS